MNAIHQTAYEPQGLPMFPKLHPVGIGRKHLLQDDMRHYQKAGRPARVRKESASRAEYAEKRKAEAAAKYKIALGGEEKTSRQLFGLIEYTVEGSPYKVSHKGIRGQLGMLVLRGNVARRIGDRGGAFYRWIGSNA